MYSHILLSVCG